VAGPEDPVSYRPAGRAPTQRLLTLSSLSVFGDNAGVARRRASSWCQRQFD
jgi:hypothetical protein